MPVLGKVGLINRGTYSASASYTALDFVLYHGSTYVALKNVSGIEPSNDGVNWQTMAEGLSLSLVNNLEFSDPGLYALDAAQGPVLKTSIDGKAPTNHASTATTYGLGNASNYGHVKVSDTYSSEVSGGNAAGGISASQNALYNVYSGITDGTIIANKAANIVTPNTDGYYTDNNGNFIHNSTSTTNYFAIKKNGSVDCYRYYFETGKMMIGGRTIVRAAGDTASLTGVVSGGVITSGQTRVTFSVPLLTVTGLTAKVTSLSVALRHAGGGYPYLCYGSSNNQYIQLGSTSVSIWANSKSVHTNGVASVGCTIKESWLYISVDFVNTLRTNAGTTLVTNNTPIGVTADLTVSFT